jgi:hypothetical protein
MGMIKIKQKNIYITKHDQPWGYRGEYTRRKIDEY